RRSKNIAWRRKGHVALSPCRCEEIKLDTQSIDCTPGSPRRGTRATYIRQRYTHRLLQDRPLAGKNPTPEQAKPGQCRHFLLIRRNHVSGLLNHRFNQIASKVCRNLDVERQRFVLLSV